MRRLFRCLVVAGFLATLVTGCRFVAGVCDCDRFDPCCTRAPWAGEGLHSVHPALYNGFGTGPEKLEVLHKPGAKK